MPEEPETEFCSGFQGFRVSGFQGLRVSGFQGFRAQRLRLPPELQKRENPPPPPPNLPDS